MSDFPRIIRPHETTPEERAAAVRDAMLAKYPNRLWLRGKRLLLMDGDGQLSRMSLSEYQGYLLGAASYEVVIKSGAAATHEIRDVPTRVAHDVYHRPDVAPQLAAVRYCPWVDARGRVVSSPGYDEETGVWLHWSGAPAPHVVENEAIAHVLETLLDFSFATAADRLAFLAALIHVVRGPTLVGHPSPLYLVTADRPGVGKSYLAQVLGALLLGRYPGPCSLGSSRMEESYSIQAVIKEESPFAWFDNVPTQSTVGSPSLDMVLTTHGKVFSRSVGSSNLSAGDPTKCLFVVTGNRLDIAPETARRTVACRLVARRGRRWRQPRLLEWALQHRPAIVGAVLALVHRWYQAGCPAPPRSLVGFERWGLLVGGPACHALADIADSWLTNQAVPKVTRDLARYIEEGWRRDGGECCWMRTAEILYAVEQHELRALVDEAGQGSDRSRQTRFGSFLSRLAAQGAILEGWQIEARSANGCKQYRAVKPDNEPGRGDDPWAGLVEDDDPRAAALVGVSLAEVDPQEGSGQGQSDVRNFGHDSGPCLPASGGTPLESAKVHQGPPRKSGIDRRESGPSGPSGPVSTAVTRNFHRKKDHQKVPEVHQGVESPASKGDNFSGPGQNRSTEKWTKVLPESWAISVPTSDPAYQVIAQMGARGVVVDVEGWRKACDEAVLKLRQDLSRAETSFDAPAIEEAESRLRALHAYSGPVAYMAAHDPECRARASWRLQGPGRIGAHDPPLQSVTRAYPLRRHIVAPPGRQLAIADWRAAHLWIAAGLSKDAALTRDMLEHRAYERAHGLWGDAAKRCTLATINGAGAAKLAKLAGLLPAEALDRRREWASWYPDLWRFIGDLEGQREWTTPLGRSVRVPPGKDYAAAALAWRWQSHEADALRLVLLAADVPACLCLHDEVVFEADEATDRIGRWMDDAIWKVAGIRELKDGGGVSARVVVRGSWGE